MYGEEGLKGGVGGPSGRSDGTTFTFTSDPRETFRAFFGTDDPFSTFMSFGSGSKGTEFMDVDSDFLNRGAFSVSWFFLNNCTLFMSNGSLLKNIPGRDQNRMSYDHL